MMPFTNKNTDDAVEDKYNQKSHSVRYSQKFMTVRLNDTKFLFAAQRD